MLGTARELKAFDGVFPETKQMVVDEFMTVIRMDFQDWERRPR
jgi:hypothetical protein